MRPPPGTPARSGLIRQLPAPKSKSKPTPEKPPTSTPLPPPSTAPSKPTSTPSATPASSSLNNRLGYKEIAYKQGDPGNYYITEIIRAIMFFNCERFDNRKHPSTLYRQQKQMLETFKEDSNKIPSPIDLIVPHVYEIMSLMDMNYASYSCCMQTTKAIIHFRFDEGRPRRSACRIT